MDVGMMGIRIAPLAEVRSAVARCLIDERECIPLRLGSVTLRPHQRTAAARLASLIRLHGGAMLAEPVGLGKTYTALAVAAECDESLLIAAPASLRAMWSEALVACGSRAAFITHDALSGGAVPAVNASFVIIDEAHRLRTTTTRRYATLADVCRRAKVLLVTATPVHNRRSDLAAQLGLFLGRIASEMSDDELARFVVRDSAINVDGQPNLAGPYRVSLPADDAECLDALLALPPPIPARDESLAVALLTYGLVHQWTSSRAALIASLDRRRARGIALMAAVDSGRRPTRGEMTAWTHDEGAVQLAFPELVVAAAHTHDASTDISLESMAAALRHHEAAIVALLSRLRLAPDPDVDRANELMRIRANHPGERIIAFCQYTQTVHALRLHLARHPGIATLTAHGARVAGGRVSREEVIRQFMPRTASSAPISASERIDLLITTDLLSEGLNLQEASVIVHLDLPWNPARLDQRVGRAQRLGSRHSIVTVYAIAPPAAAERMLQIESRLREKLSVAQHTVGIAGRILPSPLTVELERHGLAERMGAVNAELRRWAASAGNIKTLDPDTGTLVAAVRTASPELASTRGFLAVIRDADGARLVADVGSGIDGGTAAIHRAVDACNGLDASADSARIAVVCDQLRAWLVGQTAAATIDFQAATAARSRRSALARVAQAIARAPRHQRSRLAPLAAAARAVAVAPMAEGAERILEMLVESELPDEAWLRSVATFGELNARPPRRIEATSPAPSIVAIVLLEPA